jgi:hypothetical protein
MSTVSPHVVRDTLTACARSSRFSALTSMVPNGRPCVPRQFVHQQASLESDRKHNRALRPNKLREVLATIQVPGLNVYADDAFNLRRVTGTDNALKQFAIIVDDSAAPPQF